MRCTDPAADVKLRNPMTGSLPGSCARAASARAAEQRDEIAPYRDDQACSAGNSESVPVTRPKALGGDVIFY
jgi:hypothetical protein